MGKWLAIALLAGLALALGGCAKSEAPARAGAEAPPETAPSPPPPPPPPPPPAPATVPVTEACAAETLAPFPWPTPPQPSVSTLLSRQQLLAGGGALRTLDEVGARLASAIGRAGYHQSRYLGAGCNGFAIVLDLEHIEADGRRKPGADGFGPSAQEDSFSLASYVRRLFHAPPGHYRQIVFVVSAQRLAGVTAPPSEAALRAIAQSGASSLPPAFGRVPYAPEVEVNVLVYEFDKGPTDGDARQVPPSGRLGAAVHLQQAGLS